MVELADLGHLGGKVGIRAVRPHPDSMRSHVALLENAVEVAPTDRVDHVPDNCPIPDLVQSRCRTTTLRGQRLTRHRDQPEPCFLRDPPRSPRSLGVRQTLDATATSSLAPLGHRRRRHAEPIGNFNRTHTIRRQQHNPCAEDITLRSGPPSDKSFEFKSLLGRENHTARWTSPCHGGRISYYSTLLGDVVLVAETRQERRERIRGRRRATRILLLGISCVVDRPMSYCGGIAVQGCRGSNLPAFPTHRSDRD